MHGSRKPMDELVTQVRFFAMFSDRPSRVHGRAVLHTEGEKGAVRVQKEAPVHTEGEKGAVRVQKEAPVYTEGEGGSRRQSEKRGGRKGSFLEML